MKVTNNNSVNISRIYNDNKLKAEGRSGKINKGFDTVEISKEGMEIARFAFMTARMPDIGVDRIEEIKARIENGTYNVSSERLASGILSFIEENRDTVLRCSKTMEDK